MANRFLALIISATETALRTRPSACLGPRNITLSEHSRGSSGTRPGEPRPDAAEGHKRPNEHRERAVATWSGREAQLRPALAEASREIRELDGRIRVVERNSTPSPSSCRWSTGCARSPESGS